MTSPLSVNTTETPGTLALATRAFHSSSWPAPFTPDRGNVECASSGECQATESTWFDQQYSELETSHNAGDRTLWCWFKPIERACFTLSVLEDISRVQHAIVHGFRTPAKRPFDYLVFGSRIPGVFNPGGDLHLFQQRIAERDADALRHYAHRCVEIVFRNHRACEQRITTIALLEGDALGGGGECALSCDVIVAERQARMGFPEILFNLFPGMGANSFLVRRIGMQKTEEMLRSGRIYSAGELLTLGVIDLLVEQGEGQAKIRELVQDRQPRHNAQSTLYQVRRRVHPVTFAELIDIADLWVEAALRLDETDLRRMNRIIAAQNKARLRTVAAQV